MVENGGTVIAGYMTMNGDLLGEVVLHSDAVSDCHRSLWIGLFLQLHKLKILSTPSSRR